MHPILCFRNAVALTALASLACANTAHAQVTLNFENLSNPSNGNYSSQGASVTQNGFTVTDTANIGGLYSIAPNSGFSQLYTGSVALFNGAQNGDITTLTQNSGSAFTLNSIGIANLFLQPTTSGGVLFTGSLLGGGTVTQTFTHGASNSLETVILGNSFTNLTSVSFRQTTARFQFDNIVLNAPAVTPEPGSVALLVGMSVSGVGFLIRRRNQAKQAARLSRDSCS